MNRGIDLVKKSFKKSWKFSRLFTLAILTTIAFVIVSSISNWLSDDPYTLPRNADDWTAWAAWLGLFATVGAVLYAGLQFKSDLEEKRKLTEDRDAEARKDAEPLRLAVSRDWNSEDIYEDQEPDPDRVIGIILTVANHGTRDFSDIQVKVPNQFAEVKKFEVAPILQPDDPEAPSQGPHPVWGISSSNPIPVPGHNQLWLFGNLAHQRQIRITIKFGEYQPQDRWRKSITGQITGRIAVFFTDYKGHSWVRSTDGEDHVQRLWPESSEEQQPIPTSS